MTPTPRATPSGYALVDLASEIYPLRRRGTGRSPNHGSERVGVRILPQQVPVRRLTFRRWVIPDQIRERGENRADGCLPRHCPQACNISGKTLLGTPSVIYLLKALDERITFLGCTKHQTFTEKSLVLGRDAPFIKSLHTTISEIFMYEILEISMQIFIAYLEFLGHKLSNAPT